MYEKTKSNRECKNDDNNNTKKKTTRFFFSLVLISFLICSLPLSDQANAHTHTFYELFLFRLFPSP